MPKANASHPILEKPEATGAEVLDGVVIAVERVNTAKKKAARDRHVYLERLQLASANAAITIRNAVVMITKGSACALTLAAPSTAQNGTEIIIISASAYAHTVTTPSAIMHWGDSGGADDVGTFAAYKGARLHLKAFAGEWYVLNSTGVTLA